jgi:iron complex transport system substrate-binding protein
MTKSISYILLLVLLVSALSCSEREDNQAEASDAPGAKRIVSMAPNITEILFALGLGDRVVGVTDYCDYPAEALKKPKIGGMVNPNMEAIVALDPDLVLAIPSATQNTLFRTLRQFGIKVVMLPGETLADLFESIRLVGEETSSEAEAERMIGQLNAKFAEVRARTASFPKRKVMFVVGVNPLFVAGRGTFIDELIEMAGGENIAGDSLSKYPQLGIEKVVTEAPEVILYTSLNYDLTPEQTKRAKELWSPYPSLPAVREGRIHGLVADHVTLAGPRLAIGAEEIARAIHPEAFREERIN